MDITKELRTVSLCTGYGGLELGIELAGRLIKPLCYCEREAYVIANLLKEIENGSLASAPIYTDVKSFPAWGFHGEVDLLTGGYPCQPFSTAGRQRGKDDPRHLWPYILEHIEDMRPKQVFFENVYGHINKGLKQVISDLGAAGYRATWGVFSANEVGYPHERKRVFILGNAEHDGSSGSTERRSGDSSSDNYEKGSEASLQFAGASKSEDVCDLRRDKWRRLNGQLASREFGVFKSVVPRTTNGSPHRVDRTRMLGNGVVPRMAGWAWLVLNDRLEKIQKK